MVDDETRLIVQEHSVFVRHDDEDLDLASCLAVETLVRSGVGGDGDRDGGMTVKSL